MTTLGTKSTACLDVGYTDNPHRGLPAVLTHINGLSWGATNFSFSNVLIPQRKLSLKVNVIMWPKVPEQLSVDSDPPSFLTHTSSFDFSVGGRRYYASLVATYLSYLSHILRALRRQTQIHLLNKNKKRY